MGAMRRGQGHNREGNAEMLNICVSGATGWTGRELVRGEPRELDKLLFGAA